MEPLFVGSGEVELTIFYANSTVSVFGTAETWSTGPAYARTELATGELGAAGCEGSGGRGEEERSRSQNGGEGEDMHSGSGDGGEAET